MLLSTIKFASEYRGCGNITSWKKITSQGNIKKKSFK